MRAGDEAHVQTLGQLAQHVGAHAAGLDCLPAKDRTPSTDTAGRLLRDAADRIVVASRELYHGLNGMDPGEVPISHDQAVQYRNTLQLIVDSTDTYASAECEEGLDVPEREAFVRGLQSAADVARKVLRS